jgi:hypothetical protein
MSTQAASSTETMFTVTFTWTTAAWGENLTARLVNADGTTIVEETFGYGPHGMTMSKESELAEWVGIHAEETIETFFDAAAEQANQHREWRL